MIIEQKPYMNIGPGEIIHREMQALDWNQEDLAQILGLTPKTISQIMNNKQRITIETARLLSKAFNVSPEFWLNLDQNYRLRLSDDSKKMKETEIKAKIRKHMPLREMKKKGWLDFDPRSTNSLKKAFCDFWGIQKVKFDMFSKELPFCPRRNNDDENYTMYYSQTWFKKAEIEASKIKVCDYKKDKLQRLVDNIEHYTLSKEGIGEFIRQLEKCGVKFFVLSHLEKTYLDGASFMSGNNPTVVYTGRHDRVDSFWWTITHELAHVLFHLGNKKRFLDNLESDDATRTEEKEANDFSSKVLKKNEIIKEHGKLKNRLTDKSLKSISSKLNLTEPIVLGILQFSKKYTYRTKLNHCKYSPIENIPESYHKG